jgi:hypothetical protein
MPALPLTAFPAGEEILIDANIIIYALGVRSIQCVELLARCARREISGFTTVDILSDVCHRVMLAEAASRGLIGRPNAANLKGKSQVIRQLSEYWRRVQQVGRARSRSSPWMNIAFNTPIPYAWRTG